MTQFNSKGERMNDIGGYFELELNRGTEYYPNLISLNTGRNALEYVLRVRNFKKVYIPFFTCEVVLEPFIKTNTQYIFYSLDELLCPILPYDIGDDSAILVNNYFGVTGHIVEQVTRKYTNVIIDNSQAFFDKPASSIDTFYSARKFIGVPDGAYLSINKQYTANLKRDVSWSRFRHLLSRIDESASTGYSYFRSIDSSFVGNDIKLMSHLTKKILQSLDYDKIIGKRRENFNYIHKKLHKMNLFPYSSKDICCPMVYPLYVKKDGLKEFLIKNKIYVATYWPNVFDWVTENTIEYQLAQYLIPIPIDQRYSINDMKRIVSIVEDYNERK